MKDKLIPALLRFSVFALVCLMSTAAVIAVFGSLRFDDGSNYKAFFKNVTGLKQGNFVRIAGVEVGKVEKISIDDNAVAVVEFSVDKSVVLTEGTRAAIRWADPVGGRFVQLDEGVGGTRKLQPGQGIPVERTEPALDLDALLGGFKPLFRALDPDQVNALSGQLIQALQGQGGAVGSFLTQAAAVTNTLADKDDVIGQVIDNLNTVLGSLGDQSGQLAKAVESLTTVVQSLAERKGAVSNAVAHINENSATVADLLTRARGPIKTVVQQTDRAAGIVVADHDYVDDLLNTLPDAYRTLARQGMFGDYFSFYLCDVILKLNGKGGQPVFVKVVGQSTGRCAPK